MREKEIEKLVRERREIEKRWQRRGGERETASKERQICGSEGKKKEIEAREWEIDRERGSSKSGGKIQRGKRRRWK